MKAADGKYYKTDAADTEELLRIIQSIPSPKAEPFKLWLAKVGRERLDELADPEITINRALQTYLDKGYSENWVNQRLKTIEVRKELTNEWERVGIKKGLEFAILTDEITKSWADMTTKEYKKLKDLKKENLRDNMTNVELVLNMLAEVTTTEISKERNPEAFEEIRTIAKQGVEANFEFHKKWLIECKRLLKPNGTIWVSGTYHSIHPCGYAMQQLGYHILNDVIWFKPNASPNLSCKYFTASHESLVWARKNKKAKHYFNYKSMKDGDFPKDMIKKPNHQMRTVWAIAATPPDEKKFGRHPTQKPLALLERIITASTEDGAVIFDPFMGSGTTGVAALKLGRQFVGVDNNAEYCELAEKRLKAALG